MIIKPSQILKIEPEKALFVSVKENKPYFTNNLAFWKVKNIRVDSKLYFQPIFGLNKKYLQDFDFKQLLEKVLIQSGIDLQIESQAKKQSCTKQELLITNNSKLQKQSKDEQMLFALNIFLEEHDLDDVQRENIKNQFLELIANLKAFEKVIDKTQNQTIYQKTIENIDKIWNQVDRNIKWDFLKNLQNQTRQTYNQNKELYEIMENEKDEKFDFDLSDLQGQNRSEKQAKQHVNQNFETPNFAKKPLGNNPLLAEVMEKFWRQKWGDKLADEIFKDKNKKELNKNE